MQPPRTESAAAPIIEVQDICYTYVLEDGSKLPALQNVNLAVQNGEFVAIVGANGSGKSTLAHHLNGLLLPTSGQVWIDGLLTSDPRNRWAVRERVGLVFQNPDNQIIASTVIEDVAFGPENLGLPRDEIRRRVDQALHTVGLAHLAAHPPKNLSGGQKQLVAIAGALAVRTEVIVLDEPSSMLDVGGQKMVMDRIEQLNQQEGLTVVLITQSMENAARAGRLLVMDEGQVVLDGPSREILGHREQLLSLGLDVPPAVEIAHHLRANGMRIPEVILDVDELASVLCD